MGSPHGSIPRERISVGGRGVHDRMCNNSGSTYLVVRDVNLLNHCRGLFSALAFKDELRSDKRKV